MDDYIIKNCPYCNLLILIYKSEINCGIFRHGIYKDNGKQIDPHSSKEICDNLASKDLIIGCGKPFQIEHRTFNIIKCDYI